MFRNISAFSFLVFCIIGCVTSNFTTIEEPAYKGPNDEFVVQIPKDWKKYKMPGDSNLVITRDGLELQRILVSMKSTASNMTFTKRKATDDMMPQELADLFMDDLKSDNNLMNLEFVSNDPAKINDRDGFKFIYKYKTKDGLRKKGITYGFRKSKLIFTIN